MLNPTPWQIPGMFNGVSYLFEPFSEKDIWQDDHAIGMAQNLQYTGLIPLVYNELNQKKFATYEEYKRDKMIWGLKNCLNWKKDLVRCEKQAIREIKEKNGAEADRDTMNPERYEAQVKELEALILKLSTPPVKKDETPVLEEDLKENTKKRGRPARVSGSADHSSESAQ